MNTRLLIPAALFSFAGTGVPALAETLSGSTASGSSPRWQHILFIVLVVAGFAVVAFAALAFPMIRQFRREAETKAGADPLDRLNRRELESRTGAPATPAADPRD